MTDQAADILAAVKARLQGQQELIADAATDGDVLTRRTFRAELDALWACVEVLAQVVDGEAPERVSVPDYFVDGLH